MKDLAQFLASRSDPELREAHAFWGDGEAPLPSREALIGSLAARMGDPSVVARRLRDLGRKLTDLLFHFLHDPDFFRTDAELRRAPFLERTGPAEREAAVQALARRGFLFPVLARRFRDFGEAGHAVPPALGEIVLETRRREERGVYDALTLRGHLDRVRSRRRASRGKDRGKSAALLTRRAYRLLARGEGILDRVERLEPSLRRLVREAAARAGGILPRSLFDRIDLGLERFEGPAWREALERACLGTVTTLDLSRYGIRLSEETLVLFAETTIAVLRGLARERPPEVSAEAVCGVDYASNLCRLLASVVGGNVRFTAQGTIFKTTERRLADDLLPLRTREARPEEVLEGLYRFALSRRLLDRTGERTFAFSSLGRAFAALPLGEKMRRLLEAALEERELPGEFVHQIRLRRLYLRLLRRLEPSRWTDAMFLPFVARNAYLTRLDHLQVAEHFSSRSPHALRGGLEDSQQLAWNLFTWVRRRLHPLGIVDLGCDSTGRPTALRLSPFGARILGRRFPPATASAAAHLVVNPDFEVVLFPGEEDPFDLVHALDRFASRTKADHVYQYRITEESVRRAVAEGMSVAAMIAALRGSSRVGVPQNVLYSLRGWGGKAGVVQVAAVTLVRSESAEVLDRFVSDPRVREHLVERTSPTSALLRQGLNARAVRALAEDLGLHLEPA